MDENKLREAVKNNKSIASVLKDLGLKVAGGNYSTIKNGVKRLKLDTTHWTGQAHLKGKTHNWAKKIPLKEILVTNSEYQSHKLKRRLISENLLTKECSWCKLNMWRDQELSLELDHINGIHDDNRIENLRLLCPNCHSQTKTYRGKNKSKN